MGMENPYDKSDIVVYGAGFDGTTSNRPGARFASSSMRPEFYGLETYSPILELDLEDFKSQSYPNFPQFAIIFRILYENKNFILRWENFKMIYGVGKKGSYWSNYAFETFVDDFGTTIKNLPQNFNSKTIDGVIRKHSFRTGIFGYYNIIIKRIDKQWGFYEFIKWRSYLIKYSKANIIILFLISVCPSILIKELYSIYSNRL